jgi:hypothetical protein
LLILYNYLESPHFIPKSQAIEVFWNAFNCTGQFEKHGTVAVDLIHIVNSTRKYHVDENTMQDYALASEYVKNGFKDNQYVWKVWGDCDVTGGVRADIHYVDAKTGELLG